MKQAMNSMVLMLQLQAYEKEAGNGFSAHPHLWTRDRYTCLSQMAATLDMSLRRTAAKTRQD